MQGPFRWAVDSCVQERALCAILINYGAGLNIAINPRSGGLAWPLRTLPVLVFIANSAMEEVDLYALLFRQFQTTFTTML